VSFGLGTFAAADGVAYPGLVCDGHVRDLRPEFTSTLAMLRDWDAVLPRLRELAVQEATGVPLATLRPLPPVEPSGQVLCAGANYHKHLHQMVFAHLKREGDPRPDEELRLEAIETAERRATGHSWHRELVDQDGGERPSDPVLFQRWLPGSEQLHPDDRWARRRVPRLAPLLSARSLGEVRAVLDAPAAAMWDTFWDDLMPALRGAADAGWPAVVDLAWRLRERFDPLALHALDRIRGAVTTALLERLEPHLFGHAAPPLTLATYFDASLAAHAVALDGTGAADVALADSAALVARAAAGIEDRGLMMLAAFRLETLATHARGERLNRRFMPPTPAAPPIVPGFARLLPRLAEVLPDEQVTLRR